MLGITSHGAQCRKFTEFSHGSCVMKCYGDLLKYAAVGILCVTWGVLAQHLIAHANERAVGSASWEIPSILPLEMMRSPGPLPSTVIDQYV